MDKIKQKTPKHEAETCLNNSNKATLFHRYHAVLNLRVSYISRVLNFAIFSKSRKSLNLVLAKLNENKVGRQVLKEQTMISFSTLNK